MKPVQVTARQLSALFNNLAHGPVHVNIVHESWLASFTENGWLQIAWAKDADNRIIILIMKG